MIVREVLPEEKNEFDQIAGHPLQAWAWGDFREKTGLKVIRLAAFSQDKMLESYQLTVHPIPKIGKNFLYFPKGPLPNQTMLDALAKISQQENAVFVKLEPNVFQPISTSPSDSFSKTQKLLAQNGCLPGRPLFTPYTFTLDLTQSEQYILAQMKEKTRYNLKLAQKYGVEVSEDNSETAFTTYLKLLSETTQRQGFFSHTPQYHRLMWQTLQPAGIAHLFQAKYQDQILAAWVLFVFDHILYYPYGASSRFHREVMASYALAWAAIEFGKSHDCHTFDLWGSLGPNPSPGHPWYGWHRFKEGLGAQVIKFLGTYDLPIDLRLYPLVKIADRLRSSFLRLKTRLPFLRNLPLEKLPFFQ